MVVTGTQLAVVQRHWTVMPQNLLILYTQHQNTLAEQVGHHCNATFVILSPLLCSHQVPLPGVYPTCQMQSSGMLKSFSIVCSVELMQAFFTIRQSSYFPPFLLPPPLIFQSANNLSAQVISGPCTATQLPTAL